MRWLAGALLCALSVLVVVAVGAAAAVAPVVVGGDSHYPPYQFVDEDGRVTGFDNALFRAVARQADIPVRFTLGNWADARAGLRSGQIDVMPMFISPARSKLYLFSEPFLYRYHLVFGHRDSGYVDSLADLAGHRVAVQYAGLAWEALRRTGEVVIVPTRVESAAIDMLRKHKAEYALVPLNIGYVTLMQRPDDDVVALSPPVLKSAYAYAVTPDRPRLVARINRGLARVKENGTYDKLYFRWLANLKPPGTSFRRGLTVGALVALPLLLLAIVALIWLRRTRRRAAHEQQRAEHETHRRQQLEQRADYLAYNDVATGLCNQHGLSAPLAAAIDAAARAARRCALVRVDLLGLDTLRVVAGDAMERKLLGAVAERLRELQPACLVASTGHGQFALLLESVADVNAARQAAAAALEAVRNGVVMEGLRVEPHSCAGYAVYPDHADSAQGLLRVASMACGAARERGSGCVAYRPSMEPDPRNLTLLADLRSAIDGEALGCAVQPKIELASGRVVGVEMLARWKHPRYGELAPEAFIPMAESTGVVGKLTEYMVRQAARNADTWERLGRPLHVAINASVNDFSDAGLVETIIDVARGLAPCIVLEITESDLLHDSVAVLDALAALRQAGLEVSLDDFGTGYSSLTYLKRMAPEEIKIDRSFVTGLLRSERDQAIVRAAIGLAHSLGARVCAEGVESDAVLQWLRRAGCDLAQGYAIAEPMPLEQLLGWQAARAKARD